MANEQDRRPSKVAILTDAAVAASDALHRAWAHEGDWRDGVCSCEDDGGIAVDAAWPLFYQRLYVEITGETDVAP